MRFVQNHAYEMFPEINVNVWITGVSLVICFDVCDGVLLCAVEMSFALSNCFVLQGVWSVMKTHVLYVDKMVHLEFYSSPLKSSKTECILH
jgi:hypothetical protein